MLEVYEKYLISMGYSGLKKMLENAGDILFERYRMNHNIRKSDIVDIVVGRDGEVMRFSFTERTYPYISAANSPLGFTISKKGFDVIYASEIRNSKLEEIL